MTQWGHADEEGQELSQSPCSSQETVSESGFGGPGTWGWIEKRLEFTSLNQNTGSNAQGKARGGVCSFATRMAPRHVEEMKPTQSEVDMLKSGLKGIKCFRRTGMLVGKFDEG